MKVNGFFWHILKLRVKLYVLCVAISWESFVYGFRFVRGATVDVCL